MVNKANIISVAPEAITSIEVSGSFYQRLNRLIYNIGSLKGEEEMLKAILKIQNDQVLTKDGKKIDDHFAFDMETLLILIRDLEAAFQKSGHTINNEVEYELPKEFLEMKDKLQSGS